MLRTSLRAICMTALAVVFGYIMYNLNLLANLAVVDEFFLPGTPIHTGFSVVALGLWIGQLMLQLMNRFRADEDTDTPDISSPLIVAFVVGTTVIDTLMPTYGHILLNQWEITLASAAGAFLWGGIFGSLIAQYLATEAAIDAIVCWGSLMKVVLKRQPKRSPKVLTTTDAQVIERLDRVPRWANAEAEEAQ